MRFVGTFFLAALGLLAQDVTKEGSDWVRRISGGQLVPAQATRLEVRAQGGIVLRNSADNSLSYTLTQRIQGPRAEAQARQLLSGGTVTLGTMPNATVVLISDGSWVNATTTLELQVPLHFNFAALVVKFGGDISMYDFHGNVVAQTLAGKLQGDRIHGSVEARTGTGEIHFTTIDGSVDCSTGAGSITIENAGGHVTCQTGGGQTIVKQAGGPVLLNAEGGDISIERASSSVEAHSASGQIEVGQAGGKVIAITRGGAIQVGQAHDVHAESGRGTIRVRGVSGPLSLQAAMGDIIAELMNGVQLQDSTFMSRTGDIRVFMPSKLAVSVMATEDSGGNPRIQSEFSEMPARVIGWSQPPVVVRGTINGGGPVLHLSASAIYLLKTK